MLQVESRMAKKGKAPKPQGEGVPVKIDRDLATKIKYLASVAGLTIPDYLSPLIRPIIDREMKRAFRGLTDEKDPTGK